MEIGEDRWGWVGQFVDSGRADDHPVHQQGESDEEPHREHVTFVGVLNHLINSVLRKSQKPETTVLVLSYKFLKNGYPQPTELQQRLMNSMFRRCNSGFSQTYLLGSFVRY